MIIFHAFIVDSKSSTNSRGTTRSESSELLGNSYKIMDKPSSENINTLVPLRRWTGFGDTHAFNFNRFWPLVLPAFPLPLAMCRPPNSSISSEKCKEWNASIMQGTITKYCHHEKTNTNLNLPFFHSS
jgi:hypothetical protein